MNFIKRLVCKYFPPETHPTTKGQSEILVNRFGREFWIGQFQRESRDVCWGCDHKHVEKELVVDKQIG